MKNLRLLCLAFAVVGVAATASGSADQPTTVEAGTGLPPVPIDIFSAQSSYVFGSDIERNNRNFGSQEALQNEIEYGHRILMSGNLYLHLGLAYNRFDFSQTDAPVPVHLQSFAGVVGVDYMHGRDVGAFLEFRPGFYTENHIGSSSFDVSITGGRIFVLHPDKLYVFAGATSGFLRGRFPVLPIAGVIWIPNEHWRLMGILPEPRVIYSPVDHLDFWVGGQLVGGSFRTDDDPRIRPRRLDGAEVDYSEYRAGVGVSYAPTRATSMDFGAGYAIERKFDFHRAGKDFTTDPAPYLRLAVNAKF